MRKGCEVALGSGSLVVAEPPTISLGSGQLSDTLTSNRTVLLGAASAGAVWTDTLCRQLSHFPQPLPRSGSWFTQGLINSARSFSPYVLPD